MLVEVLDTRVLSSGCGDHRRKAHHVIVGNVGAGKRGEHTKRSKETSSTVASRAATRVACRSISMLSILVWPCRLASRSELSGSGPEPTNSTRRGIRPVTPTSHSIPGE